MTDKTKDTISITVVNPLTLLVLAHVALVITFRLLGWEE